jgi:hypothetical protein
VESLSTEIMVVTQGMVHVDGIINKGEQCKTWAVVKDVGSGERRGQWSGIVFGGSGCDMMSLRGHFSCGSWFRVGGYDHC